MFHHPARGSSARRSYGELGGYDFYAIVLPTGFQFSDESTRNAWRSRGVKLTAAGGLPDNSVVVVETYVPGMNYDIVWANGTDFGGRKLEVGFAANQRGFGSSSEARSFEDVLEKYAKGSHEARAKAVLEAEALWTPASDTGTSESSEEVVSAYDLSTSDAGKPAAAEKPKAGYYTDSEGWAWYYSTISDYMEAVAAPKGKYSVQPRFDASTGADRYAKMKGVLTPGAFKGSDKAARAAVIANAVAQGGAELPASRGGRQSAPSSPPASVVARGEEKTAEAPTKLEVKGGFRGAVSAVPTWAWITLGGVVLVGGGVYARYLYKHRSA